MALAWSVILSLMNLEVRLTFHLPPRVCDADWKFPLIELAATIGMHRHQNDRTMQCHRQLSRVELFLQGWTRPFPTTQPKM